MIKRLPWYERTFPTGLAAHLLPGVAERLRGTPARVRERLIGVQVCVLVRRLGESWSIQENVGHLLDVEPLWRQRAFDLTARRTVLAEADLSNRRTHEAAHNDVLFDELLAEFGRVRAELVCQLEGFSEEEATFAALHPRLKQPMNAVDLAFFVAEHDDYHLARISELLAAGS
jgi:uncharacterized damage-inducible protein DinB